jgi:hypothetical protein
VRIACGIFRKEAASWIVAACSTFLFKSRSIVDMLTIDYLGGAGEFSSSSHRNMHSNTCSCCRVFSWGAPLDRLRRWFAVKNMAHHGLPHTKMTAYSPSTR